MFGLELADWIALIVYMIGITALGTWMARTVKDSADFFVAGRRFGKLLAIFSVFGAGTHSDQAVSVVAKTYTSGMSGIWYQWLWLFVTPFNWWIAPVMRRCRAITTGDYFEARYDRSVATLYVVAAILQLMVSIGVVLKGAGAVIVATTGNQLNETWAIAILTLLFVTYGVAGGLAAAIVTDFVQGMLTIVFSFILLPFAIYQVGGFSGLHAGVAETVQKMYAGDPVLSQPEAWWSLVAPGEIGWFYIIMLVVNAIVGIVVQPHVMPISGAVKTERESQIGSVYGTMIKRVCTVAWTFLGMYAIATYPGLTRVSEIDQIFGRIAYELLPKVSPGLLGIFVAALIASIMAACDALMITSAGLFTQNLYRPFIAPDRSQRHYVTVGRIASAATVAGGVFIAFKLSSVISGLEKFWMVAALMGIAFWAGLFWRRATVAGAWASTLVAGGLMLLSNTDWFLEWARVHATWMLYSPDADKLYLPMQMLLYLSGGMVAMGVVSLLTRPPAREKLDRFYETMRTPVEPGEKIDMPVRLPAGREPAPQRKLIPLPNWEIQVPTRRAIVGFLWAWVMVLGLIGLVKLLVSLGA